MPKIIYDNGNIENFDLKRFTCSLQNYVTTDGLEKKIIDAMDDEGLNTYNPLYIDTLVELGANIIYTLSGETLANDYLAKHRNDNPLFKRIKRITGYLVSTFDKLNDPKGLAK